MRSRNSTSSIFVAIAALAALAACALQTLADDGIPTVLTTRLASIDKTYPTWVSAAAAVRPDGSWDPGLFHPAWLDRLHNLLVEPPDPIDGCIPSGEVFWSWMAPPDVSSFEATYRSAQRVLRGRIVGREFGFDRGTPGQLFETEVLEAYKGGQDLATYYFFVPVGRFEVGKIKICKRDYRFSVVPAVGDEVVLMIPESVAGDPLLDLRFEQGLIVLRGDQALLPDFTGANEAKSVDRARVFADLSRMSAGDRQ